MTYYPHAFNAKEVENWIFWNIENYKKYNHGLWAVIQKNNKTFLGDCGITMQNIAGDIVPEIGFHIIKKYCNQGYATEAASACLKYAFDSLNYNKIYSYSNAKNIPSQKVAKKIGMYFEKTFYKKGSQQVVYVAKKKEI
jgi:RimJ/RimL family protein N-acetyltransferase